MKPEKNWQQKTLEVLEKNVWPDPVDTTMLIKRCHALRKLPLDQFSTEDIRMMIGQQIGLTYLIPLALDILTKDLFAAGDFFEGDLLKNVLEIDTVFWNDNREYWQRLYNLIDHRREEIHSHKFDTTKFYRSVHR
ncbi:contact-dependent growth inhibition system immunity protein [Terrimonas rubra]|uniref:Contact-dependent growth inhibition system immunity protein n=1 Tax=Terrimonas rubra TaxID=1035890 RepID=A0ABW6A3T9_9BACT